MDFVFSSIPDKISCILTIVCAFFFDKFAFDRVICVQTCVVGEERSERVESLSFLLEEICFPLSKGVFWLFRLLSTDGNNTENERPEQRAPPCVFGANGSMFWKLAGFL